MNTRFHRADEVNFNRKSAYLVLICVAGAIEVLCPISERSYSWETVSEVLALLCIATSLLAFCVAGMWVRNAKVSDLVGAGFLSIAIPFIEAFLLWLFQVQLNVHGVSMGGFLLHSLLSLLAASLLFISASVKHLRATN